MIHHYRDFYGQYYHLHNIDTPTNKRRTVYLCCLLKNRPFDRFSFRTGISAFFIISRWQHGYCDLGWVMTAVLDCKVFNEHPTLLKIFFGPVLVHELLGVSWSNGASHIT